MTTKHQAPAIQFAPLKSSQIAGVQRWEDLKGKTIRVEADHCGVRRIGHIVREDWFCPDDDFGALNK